MLWISLLWQVNSLFPISFSHAHTKRHMWWRRHLFLIRKLEYNVNTTSSSHNSSLTYIHTRFTKDRIRIQRLRPNYATTRHIRRKHGPFRSTLHPKRHARITFWYRGFKRLYTAVQETSSGAGWSNFPSASSAFSTMSIWETEHVDFLFVGFFSLLTQAQFMMSTDWILVSKRFKSQPLLGAVSQKPFGFNLNLNLC